MWLKWRLLRCAIKMAWMIIRERPDVIVSTGAAPGFFAIVYGKLLGKKTIWVDSIANAEALSLSGSKLARHADLWLTQWKHLATPQGPHYFGNVLSDEEEPTLAEKNQDSPTNLQSAISNSQPKQILRIFVTIGTDLPFDRLIKAVDEWAPRHPNYEIFAQIGDAKEKPKHISFTNHIDPPEYQKKFDEADVIISHAGMGTILTALIKQKSLIVLPRIAALGEHRNEHQLATAKHLQDMGMVTVAENETNLITMLEKLDELSSRTKIGPYASESLNSEIARFIAKGKT